MPSPKTTSETVDRDVAESSLSTWRSRLGACFSSPLFAYAFIATLQMHVMWDVWSNRDLPYTCSSEYFVHGQHWWETGELKAIHFSPLYSRFFGLMYGVTHDAVTASWLHRVMIAVSASLLVLGFLRQLLPAALALYLAAWWTILPINFNTHNEVHLFAVIPILVAWLFTTMKSQRWGRGWAIGTLVLATILMRNELFIATGLFGLATVVMEWRAGGVKNLLNWRTLVPYVLPLVVAGGIIAEFWSHVPDGFDFDKSSRAKHTVNMGQVYAFGWKQRHPEWTGNPWVGYGPLMVEHFGSKEVTFFQMLKTNPSAMMEHFLWNLRLTPGGLELLLFDSMSGSKNPDYTPVKDGRSWPQYLFVALLCVLGFGLWKVVRERQQLIAEYFAPHASTWLILLSTVVVSIPVILSQRPRPAYLFSLSVFLMLCVGVTLHLVLRQVRLGTLSQGWINAAALALFFCVSTAYSQPENGSMTVRGTIERLAPFERELNNPNTVLVSGPWAPLVQHYLGHGKSKTMAYQVFGDKPPEADLVKDLDRVHANLFYVDNRLLNLVEQRDPKSPFVHSAAPGWKLIGGRDVPGDRWRLYQRIPARVAKTPRPAAKVAQANKGPVAR